MTNGSSNRLIWEYLFMDKVAVRKPIGILATMLALLAFIPSMPLAVSVNGSLTNTFWTRNGKLENADESQMDIVLYEYLRFHARDLGSRNISAYVSGRVGWDRYEVYDDKYMGSLYQGYVDWRLSNRSDLRIGRQFLLNDTGLWQMDGIRFGLRTSSVSPAFYAGMAASPWTLDENNGVLLGAELKTRKIWRVRSKFSFHSVLDNDGDLDRAIVGIQLDTSEMGFLALHSDSDQRFNVSARGSMDLLTRQILAAHISVGFRFLPKTQLYAKYQQKIPLFPLDSIFSTFSFEPLHQLSINLDNEITRFLSLQGSYSRQFLDSEDIDRYGAGFSLGSKYESPLSIRLERLHSADTRYWRVYSHLRKQFGHKISIGFSNYYNNYRLTNALQSKDAYSFQLKVGYKLSRKMQAFVRIEDNINPEYEYNVWVVGYLRMGFGYAR